MIREEESRGERERETKVDKLDPDEKFWIHKFVRVCEEGAIAQELETC